MRFFLGLGVVLNHFLCRLQVLVDNRGSFLCGFGNDGNGFGDGFDRRCSSSGQFSLFLQTLGFTLAATHFTWVVRRAAIAGQRVGGGCFGNGFGRRFDHGNRLDRWRLRRFLDGDHFGDGFNSHCNRLRLDSGFGLRGFTGLSFDNRLGSNHHGGFESRLFAGRLLGNNGFNRYRLDDWSGFNDSLGFGSWSFDNLSLDNLSFVRCLGWDLFGLRCAFGLR